MDLRRNHKGTRIIYDLMIINNKNTVYQNS